MTDKNSGIDFRFRRNDTLGSADAESDDYYLSDCFVETGDLNALRDCSNAQRIIVGRTGAGKSALIRMLKEVEDNVIELSPQNLSLSYISNSDILNFFEAAGVNLDLFYQVLWRHVLTVELLKYRYDLRTPEKSDSFLASLFGKIKNDRSKEKAIEYLREWGEKFWDETEYRVKEITTKVETDLTASVGAGIKSLKFDTHAGQKLTEEQKKEVVQSGRKVVNDIQIKALSDVIKFLADDVFDDGQQKYFITIDGLDEHWVEDALRYKLIRALVETVRSFQRIKNVKIVISIRIDLLERVIEKTRDSGFQEEKYNSLYLRLRWSRQQLENVLDRRIEKLIKQRYTSRPVKLKELFPKTMGKQPFLDFLLDRTFYRPRDAILFINSCLEHSEGKNSITSQIVSLAEGEYSRRRLVSLQEEWAATFPNLARYIKLLIGLESTFKIGALNKTHIEEICYNDVFIDLASQDEVFTAARDLFLDNKGTLHGFILVPLRILYVVGLIGIKPDATTSTFWSFHSTEIPSSGSIKPSSIVSIHPTFWRTLGIKFNK